jgi:hypothetical protein
MNSSERGTPLYVDSQFKYAVYEARKPTGEGLAGKSRIQRNVFSGQVHSATAPCFLKMRCLSAGRPGCTLTASSDTLRRGLHFRVGQRRTTPTDYQQLGRKGVTFQRTVFSNVSASQAPLYPVTINFSEHGKTLCVGNQFRYNAEKGKYFNQKQKRGRTTFWIFCETCS